MVGLRVVLAEDDVLLREGLASLLDRSGLQVVGQTGDGERLLALARSTRPDLVIADIRMPPTHSTEGLEAARTIRQELPDTGILVLSAYVDVEHAMELLAGGRGVGYLLKSRVTDVADFLDTLARVAKGGSVVDPALVRELVSANRRNDPLAQLSAREREMLAVMAEGHSNAGIGRRLWITEGPNEKHVRSILNKLDLPDTDDHHRRVLAVLKVPRGPLTVAAATPAHSRSSRQNKQGLQEHHDEVAECHGCDDGDGERPHRWLVHRKTPSRISPARSLAPRPVARSFRCSG